MAKWRLKSAHYLNVPGVEWEYKETTRDGRQGRQMFNVPMLLDPKDPNCCNHDGDCIVIHGKAKNRQGEYEFSGDPTPDMEPMDEEAEAISKSFEGRWVHPIDSLPSTGDYSASLIASFEKQMTKLMQNQPAEPVSVSASAVSKEDFDKLQAQVAALMARNAELEAQPKAQRRA
jgi:hypothetical protein